MSFKSGPRMGRGGMRGSRGNGRSNGRFVPQGPPDTVLEMGKFMHPCEGDIVCKSINTKIPYFNAPIYLLNKTQIGKVDEILGPLNEVYFTVKCSEGVHATSFRDGDKFYIGPDKLLPIERFLPKPKVIGPPKPKKKRAPTKGGRGGFGGRGSDRGGFGRGRGGGFGRGRGGGFNRGRGGRFSRGRGGKRF